ncbi:MAG: VWA domain-containing protein [Victivallales bacterium]|nr:VWA domain-containing protein [Victivallales bacterium]
MSFLKIHFLWHLLWVIPFISLLYYHAALRRKKTLRMILGKRATDPEYISVSRYARYLKFMLLLTGVAMLILAAARPYWGQMIAPYSGRGRDLIVIFDVSKSMLAEDVQPSRLEHAKWFVRRLVDDCPGDRFGLIAFSGTSFLECPLTTDRTSFFQYLNELDTSSIPVGGTNVQAALETALKAFDAAETGHRAVILITDGDELDGDSRQVIDELKKKHIPVLAVGIGDPMKPGLIPIKNPDGTSSFMKDSSGEIVKTRLNEKPLIELAQATGGCYARSTAANINIDRVLRRVQSLAPKELDEGMKTRPIERFYYPLTAGLILLLMWFCISERKETKVNNKLNTSISPKLMLLLLLLSGTALMADTGQNGKDKQLPPPLTAENDKTAKPSALDAAAHIDDPVKLYNLALEMQRQNSPEAGEMYRRAINMATKNRQVQSASYQNMGVIQHEKARGKIQESMKLVEQQNLDGALKGLDAVKKELTVAEDLYVEAMVAAEEQESGRKSSTAQEGTPGTDIPAPENVSHGSIAMNQQKLLLDRSMVEELKKKIEELKKKQQEAQKKIQKAKQEQQKQNQDKPQQDKQEQKQDKQQNQQDKQEQNQQDKQDQAKPQQNQNQAEQSRKDAQQAVEDLKQSAEELKQENLQKSAQDAADELKKAEQAQQKDQGKKAEEHLENALEKLRQAQQKNQEQQDKQNQENKEKSEKQDDKKDDAKQKEGQTSAADKQDKPLPQPQQQQQKQAAEAAAKEQDEKIDKQQAEALLRAMADQEKNLRDALKENMKRNYRHKPVEKDW